MHTHTHTHIHTHTPHHITHTTHTDRHTSHMHNEQVKNSGATGFNNSRGARMTALLSLVVVPIATVHLKTYCRKESEMRFKMRMP